MKKVPSLFIKDAKRGLAIEQFNPEAQWVVDGKGYATIKIDGICCLIENGTLYKQHSRRLKRSAKGINEVEEPIPYKESDFREAQSGWKQSDNFDIWTGDWPGWLKVDLELPANKHFTKAWNSLVKITKGKVPVGTYELIGPGIHQNCYGLKDPMLVLHGTHIINPDPPRTHEGLKKFFHDYIIEGIVWYNNDDDRMVKAKRLDFGLPWPRPGIKM